MSDPRREAADVLKYIGMNPKYRGYIYMLLMLQITQNHPQAIFNLSRELYSAVAKEYGVSLISVERGVRFAIRRTWEDGNIAVLRKLFGGYDRRFAPTNGEFIATVTECLLFSRLGEVQLKFVL